MSSCQDVSVKDDQSISHLLEKMTAFLQQNVSHFDNAFVTRERHRQLLSSAKAELDLFAKERSLELQCERLRLSATEIGKITGKIQVDELLDIIFSSFCIGK